MNGKRTKLKIKDLRIDLENQTVSRSNSKLDVSGLSFLLLTTLAKHWPETVSHRELENAVWGGVVISGDALRQRIRLLRQALGNEEYVKTVKGVGYRLAFPVQSSRFINAERLLVAVAVTGLIAFLTISLMPTDRYHELKHSIKHNTSLWNH